MNPLTAFLLGVAACAGLVAFSAYLLHKSRPRTESEFWAGDPLPPPSPQRAQPKAQPRPDYSVN